jgi:predicted phage terminase large subunit-like protein
MKRSNRRLIKPKRPGLLLPPTPQEITQALIQTCRQDFMSFAMLCMAELNPGTKLLHNYHLEALAFRLERVRKGACRALMINMPPRYGKSVFTSVAFPAYILGVDPTRRIIVVSHSMELAVTLSNDFRRILNSAWYGQMFPETCGSRMKNTEQEIHTTRGGFRLAASIEGNLTGRGGHFLIFDDPINAADVYSDSKRSRVNALVRECSLRIDDKKTGAIIIAMQRLHADDTCGHLLSEPNHWTVLSMPAIAEEDESIQLAENKFIVRHAGEALDPEREPVSVLNDTKSQCGSTIFQAHYQQRPVPRDGLIFKRDWLQWYDQVPNRTHSTMVYQSWDTAIKSGQNNDYTAGVTLMIQDKKFWVIDVVRARLDYPDLLKLARSHAERHQPTRVLVEDSGLGNALFQDLRRAGLNAIAIKPQRDKVTRMRAQAAKFEQQLVHFPRQAIWLGDCLDELLSVPNARFDDQVDALCQALAYVEDSSYTGWNDRATKNFSNFIEALAFDAYFRGLR